MYRSEWSAGRDPTPRVAEGGFPVQCIHEPGLFVATRGASRVCLACLVNACADARFAGEKRDGIRVMILQLESVVLEVADALGRTECRARVHAEVPPGALAALAHRVSAELASPGAPPTVAGALGRLLLWLVEGNGPMAAAAVTQLAESGTRLLELAQDCNWVGPMEIFGTLACGSQEVRNVALDVSSSGRLFLAMMDVLHGAARNVHAGGVQKADERVTNGQALVIAARVLSVLWGDLASTVHLETWCPAELVQRIAPEVARAYVAAPHGLPEAAPLILLLECMASDANHARSLCAPNLDGSCSITAEGSEEPILVRAILRALNVDDAGSQTTALSTLSHLARMCSDLVPRFCHFNVVEHILDAIRQECLRVRNSTCSDSNVLSQNCRSIDAGLFCLSSLMTADPDATCARLAVGNSILGRCTSLLAHRLDVEQPALLGICCSLLGGSARAYVKEHRTLSDSCSLLFVFASVHEAMAERETRSLEAIETSSAEVRVVAVECVRDMMNLAKVAKDIFSCAEAVAECAGAMARRASPSDVTHIALLIVEAVTFSCRGVGNIRPPMFGQSLAGACRALLPVATSCEDSRAITCLACAALDVDAHVDESVDILGYMLQHICLDKVFDLLIEGAQDDHALAAGWALFSRAHSETQEKFHPRIFWKYGCETMWPSTVASILALVADESEPNQTRRIVALGAVRAALVDGMW